MPPASSTCSSPAPAPSAAPASASHSHAVLPAPAAATSPPTPPRAAGASYCGCRGCCSGSTIVPEDGLSFFARTSSSASRAYVPVGRVLRTRGGRSSAGRAPGCGPGGRGFESRRSPLVKASLRRGFSSFRATPERRSHRGYQARVPLGAFWDTARSREMVRPTDPMPMMSATDSVDRRATLEPWSRLM